MLSEFRKLAAIVAADVVGYSRLAGVDEDRTLARLRALRSDLIDPTIAVHHGRVVKRTGDGALIVFRSVVDAVRCAIEVQNGMVERNAGLPPERRIEFRIGIHLGDVVEESDGDLMGDGVNIATRLEGIAKPGAICLSEDAYRQVKARLDLAVNDLGATQLKNIAEPVRVYSLEVGVPTQAKPVTEAKPPEPSARLALPDKPSIAVLPFQNMSGDPEQEYFADGIVEDIVTALSRVRSLFVIARNSSFTYKGKAVDVKQVGRELGVRYVLEGSVRKAGGRVRITCQLIEAATNHHVWADRFEGTLEDIFGLQDRVTESVVGAIAPRVEQGEIQRAKRKPTEALSAYDHYLRGLASVYLYTREGNEEASRLFHRAIEIDPEFATAFGLAAYCRVQQRTNGWFVDYQQLAAEASRLANRAIELGGDDAVALGNGGFALAYVVGKVEEGSAWIDRALALDPSNAAAWRFSGFTKLFLGHHDAAISCFTQAIRFSPFDQFVNVVYYGFAFAYFYVDRLEEASIWAEKGLHLQSEASANYAAIFVNALIQAGLGRDAAAREARVVCMNLRPSLRISNVHQAFPFRRPEDIARTTDAMKKAGFPQ